MEANGSFESGSSEDLDSMVTLPMEPTSIKFVH